jgi:hypothetical protein
MLGSETADPAFNTAMRHCLLSRTGRRGRSAFWAGDDTAPLLRVGDVDCGGRLRSACSGNGLQQPGPDVLASGRTRGGLYSP